MSKEVTGFNKSARGVVRIEGDMVGLPERMTPQEGAGILKKYDDEQNKMVEHIREYPEYAWQDVAVQLTRGLRDTFGWASGASLFTMMGEVKPRTTRIAIGPGQYEEALWSSRFELQAWGAGGSGSGTGMIRPQESDDGTRQWAQITFTVQQRYADQVAGLFDLVDDYLLRFSIYRGQAVNTDLTFLEPSTFIHPSSLVFDEATRFSLEANIFLPIREHERLLAMGADAKRGVLLAGPYGTGKTLTAMAAAWQADQSGWTFLYIPSNAAADLPRWLEWATVYAPTVVFMEDVDIVLDQERDNHLNNVLNTVDGLTTKGRSILTILTTNHLTDIHPGLLRPGRLDALIRLDLPSAAVRATMLKYYADAEPETDFMAAAEACEDTEGEGYPGAAIREVAERASRYAYLEGRHLVNTDDLIGVAHSMRAHIDLTKERQPEPRPPLDETMRAIVHDEAPKGRRR